MENNSNNNMEQVRIEQVKEVRRKRVLRKAFLLLLLFGVTTSVFIVATFAWFIGITEVSVSNFEIQVSSMPGLEISLDAANFSQEISITKANITATNTSTNNHWAGDDGLMPISSPAALRSDGRITFYSKASITSSQGGFRIRTEEIDNSTAEQDGYIAFDLFIRNRTNSNPDGVTTYNPEAEEGVYLLSDSNIAMTAEGEGGDGIQNSARVAFYQLGRAGLNTDAATIRAIGCSSNPSSVLSLCNVHTTNTTIGNGRGWTWNIWEPNDTAHTTQSINHYNTICLTRTSASAYGTSKCSTLTNGTAVTTYAANKVINSSDNVNIYDGLNTYMGTIGDNNFLKRVDYYTDTMNSPANVYAKPEFFFLAPNTITKVRVYVWLEGQDVDNFDVGTIGKKLKVEFGFTKDKFELAK